MEEDAEFAAIIGESVTTLDLRLTEDRINLQIAEQQKENMENMVEERNSLRTIIKDKNKHILEIEKKEAKSAEDANVALAMYTKANNQIKDLKRQVNAKCVTMLMEKDDMQEQLQQLKKIYDAEAQDKQKMIECLKTTMAEAENEKNRNADTVQMLYNRIYECQGQLNVTKMQSETEKNASQRATAKLQDHIKKLSAELKEVKNSVIKTEADKITSQRAVTKLQSNLRIVSEDLRGSRQSVTNSEAEKIVSQRTILRLQNNLRNVFEELDDLTTRLLNKTDKLQVAEQKVIELTKSMNDQKQDKELSLAKLDQLDKENKDLENQLRSNEIELELLKTSIETERNKHESAMEWLHVRCTEMESELKRYKDAHFNLLLKLDSVHNYSKISIEESALVDKTFIDQRLEDERAKEEHLAEETTYVINKFTSAKDRHEVIKSFKRRIEKESCSSPANNQIPSDNDSGIEYDTTVSHTYCDIKYCKERLAENNTTTNCHNKREKNTNVFNINMNIADSKVSFIDKTEEQMLSLNGGSDNHQAIEETYKL